MNLSALIFSFILVAPPAGQASQTTFPAPPPPQSTQCTVDPTLPQSATYTIGPEDEIRIFVVGDEQLTNVFRVQSDGGITLPYLNTVQAQGLTAIKLQELIRSGLVEGQFFRRPEVRVEVSKYGSQFVTIQGEVRIPQRLAMTGPMTLLEALSAAGSWTPNASSVVTVARKQPSGGGAPQDAVNCRISLDDLSHGVANANIALMGGDIITVPKAETIFVQGQVKTVGVYNWEPGLTVIQAITKAGGLSDRGRNSGFKITRLVDGKNKEFDVKPTDPVQPNDLIIVPPRRF